MNLIALALIATAIGQRASVKFSSSIAPFGPSAIASITTTASLQIGPISIDGITGRVIIPPSLSIDEASRQFYDGLMKWMEQEGFGYSRGELQKAYNCGAMYVVRVTASDLGMSKQVREADEKWTAMDCDSISEAPSKRNK